MKVTSKVFTDEIKIVDKKAILSLIQTADALKSDVQQSQTMPFGDTIYEKTTTKKRKKNKNNNSSEKISPSKDSKAHDNGLKSNLNNNSTRARKKRKILYQGGTLQNKSTFVDSSTAFSGVVRVVSSTPYARRLYFHPEYNFNQKQNKHAGGMWFEPYVRGKKKDFVKKTFTKIMKGKMK